jgi:hypothetical protein
MHNHCPACIVAAQAAARDYAFALRGSVVAALSTTHPLH